MKTAELNDSDQARCQRARAEAEDAAALEEREDALDPARGLVNGALLGFALLVGLIFGYIVGRFLRFHLGVP